VQGSHLQHSQFFFSSDIFSPPGIFGTSFFTNLSNKKVYRIPNIGYPTFIKLFVYINIYIGYPITYFMLCTCNMKGFLTFLILWILRSGEKRGSEIAEELEKRRGSKPSPGTIYPALKELKKHGFIRSDKDKKYFLTPKGKKELTEGCNCFCTMFYDFPEIKKVTHNCRCVNHSKSKILKV
jgi:PadR family transcriptional regulator, regulatory protein PadR